MRKKEHRFQRMKKAEKTPKKQIYTRNKPLTKKDYENENMTEIVFDKKLTYEDEDSNREIALPELVNDDIRHDTEDPTILPCSQSMPNKPVAIVRPCQKSETKFMITEHDIENENVSIIKLNIHLKVSDLKKVNSNQQEDTNTEVKFKDKSKDIHDDMNSLSKAKKIYNENKEIMRTKTITEKDVIEI